MCLSVFGCVCVLLIVVGCGVLCLLCLIVCECIWLCLIEFDGFVVFGRDWWRLLVCYGVWLWLSALLCLCW